ncbi:MAG: DNA polymerase IV [Propionibacteriaceae bacterium]|jgi:DNA polymerase-4|nr:DNA polymerase IV [Propionibacteriaceae bacterium]
MRAEASILHLDLDAFFAAVEQRDKPSLRGKPVIVGGISGRGVVSTASYEARRFGVHSAMPMHEARRLCPNAAYLSGRFGAYRLASKQVMAILHGLSPLVEPMSLDEAFVDLAAGGHTDFSVEALTALAARLRRDVERVTGGLTASVGIATSKFVAKLASEEAKPDGAVVVVAGTEADRIAFLNVRAIPGVGPATAERLARLGIRTVVDLRRATAQELRRELGSVTAEWLSQVACARDDRGVSASREVKSISLEDTFESDLTRLDQLEPLVIRDAALVAARLRKTGLFARTITVKLKLADFTIHTRSRTLLGAVDSDQSVERVAVDLLGEQGRLLAQGVRLLGVAVSSFTSEAQETLFEVSAARSDESRVEAARVPERHRGRGYRPGDDVTHEQYGPGWVWGTGLDLVTVRFETAATGPGPIRTFRVDDPQLRSTPVVVDDEASVGPGWLDE